MVGLVGLAGCGGDASTTNELEGAARHGQQLAADKGCQACHAPDGQGSAGPAWEGMWATSVELDDGRTVLVDRDYVARSVQDPDADVVEGYPAIMPSFELSETEMDQLVAYLEAIGP